MDITDSKYVFLQWVDYLSFYTISLVQVPRYHAEDRCRWSIVKLRDNDLSPGAFFSQLEFLEKQDPGLFNTLFYRQKSEENFSSNQIPVSLPPYLWR